MHRKLQIQSVLCRAIAKIFMEGKVCSHGVSVSKINLSNDLKVADVFIALSFWSKGDKHSVLAEIKQSSYFIYKLLLKDVSLRYVPKLNFKLDDDQQETYKNQ
ncbi:ribosome-binding factor A [Candidatus Mesenet endosymbiont of Phosphuga atrata]|uniref:ribosome-binding factor A n=1 Tax=Candidatus Mesenet endosymbiont of Phosphuga atrata TaxID=3066221 RepID=UPI0030D54509